MKEIEIQEKVTLFATSIGMLPVRINVVGRKGWPDYGYGYRGVMFFIEYKRPGEKPEKLQEYVHGIIRRQGFNVYVVDNIEYGISRVRELKHAIDNGEYVAEVR